MFDKSTYIQRRRRLRESVCSGVILLPGNWLSPMNYTDNAYPFRQDSSFLYYLGLDAPALAAVIDVDAGTECVFGDDATPEDIVWTGPQPALHQRCEESGVGRSAAMEKLCDVLTAVRRGGRVVHWLPPYRAENVLRMASAMGVSTEAIVRGVSESLIRAVVAQRSIKTAEEVEQIELATETCYEMQVAAMRTARPGMYEREIAGLMEGIAISRGVRPAFETIFSVHGETLHNPFRGNLMKAGDIAVNDCGAESPMHYAGDITRAIPIGGRFDSRQRDIYRVVLEAQRKAIEAVRPGVEFRDVHLLAARELLTGLKAIGLAKGDVETAAEEGAHTLFFQCGLGHMMGLDVHDMGALGEDYVGYTRTIRRNPAFGFKSLRLAKALEPGFVVTVEPGLYFIPALMDRYRAQRRFEQYIDYDVVETYRDFGGVRIEDGVLVTDDGCRVLGRPIPKEMDEVERLCSC